MERRIGIEDKFINTVLDQCTEFKKTQKQLRQDLVVSRCVFEKVIFAMKRFRNMPTMPTEVNLQSLFVYNCEVDDGNVKPMPIPFDRRKFFSEDFYNGDHNPFENDDDDTDEEEDEEEEDGESDEEQDDHRGEKKKKKKKQKKDRMYPTPFPNSYWNFHLLSQIGLKRCPEVSQEGIAFRLVRCGLTNIDLRCVLLAVSLMQVIRLAPTAFQPGQIRATYVSNVAHTHLTVAKREYLDAKDQLGPLTIGVEYEYTKKQLDCFQGCMFEDDIVKATTVLSKYSTKELNDLFKFDDEHWSNHRYNLVSKIASKINDPLFDKQIVYGMIKMALPLLVSYRNSIVGWEPTLKPTSLAKTVLRLAHQNVACKDEMLLFDDEKDDDDDQEQLCKSFSKNVTLLKKDVDDCGTEAIMLFDVLVKNNMAFVSKTNTGAATITVPTQTLNKFIKFT
jgi:hypothetical protein